MTPPTVTRMICALAIKFNAGQTMHVYLLCQEIVGRHPAKFVLYRFYDGHVEQHFVRCEPSPYGSNWICAVPTCKPPAFDLTPDCQLHPRQANPNDVWFAVDLDDFDFVDRKPGGLTIVEKPIGLLSTMLIDELVRVADTFNATHGDGSCYLRLCELVGRIIDSRQYRSYMAVKLPCWYFRQLKRLLERHAEATGGMHMATPERIASLGRPLTLIVSLLQDYRRT